MPILRNFEEAREALKPLYFANVMTNAAVAYKLDRMRALMEHLGNPQEKLKIVHVAGTSGKTSTAYYVSALLEQSGASVGLTVSPHVAELNERMQINHAPIPEAAFCRGLGEFMDIVAASSVQPTYFELLVAYAFWQFERMGVDYAVVEVGLGGLLDGTNVVSRPDKVCIITDIGLDHTNILGKTLPEIAAQKAGIMQPGNQVFAYTQAEEVMEVFRDVAARQQATLHEVTPAADLPQVEKSLPLFQQRNFYLALQAANYILERDHRSILTPAQLANAASVNIPGRMEMFKLQGKTIVLDGAHNGQKMEAFIESLRQKFPGEPFAALVAFAKARDNRWQYALDELLPNAERLIITSFQLEPDDTPKDSLDVAEVAAYITPRHGAITTEPDTVKAFQALLDAPESLLVVTGSLYLLGLIYPMLPTSS